MFSLFKKQQDKSIFQQSLLDDNELQKLRAFAEQLDCSSTPELTLETRLSGSLPTRALGSGIDYAESRLYQQGDDPRSINWRLSARSQETFVKTYHIESRPSLSILLDRRRSMVFGTRRRLKITQALRAASLLAYATEFHHISFQAWIIDDKQGMYHYDDASAFLLHANEACPPAFKPKTCKISIDSILQDIYQQTSKGSLVYLISDFVDINDSKNLAQLHEQCFIQAIHIMDKAELVLPRLGKIRLQDMLHTRNYRLNTQKEKERHAFTQLAEQTLEKRKSIMTDLGISYARLSTDTEDIQHQIILPFGQS